MKKSDFVVILLASVIVIAICATPFIIYLNSPVKEGISSFNISKFAKIVSEVEIHNQVPMGDINIMELNYASGNIIEAEWEIKYAGPYFPQYCVLITYTFENSRMIIHINTRMDIDIMDLNLNIYFNPCYTYSFISNTESGNLNFDADDIDIKDFYFRTSSGNLNIKLSNSNIENDADISTNSGEIRLRIDHSTFYNNFYCLSESGVQLFDLWNIRFNSKADFNVSSNIGYIRLYWANHFNKSQNLNINTYSNRDFEIKIWCPIEIMRCQVSLSTLNGSTRFARPSGTFEEVSENHYQTHKINDTALDLYNITAISTSGEAFVYYVDCFKWSRSCDWAQDFFPYNVDKSGNYTLYREDYNVNTIDFLNTKYIYLNESRSLNINFEALPVSSEKLFFIEWDLEYIHAMGIGVGDLNIEISKKKLLDTLSIYLKLIFVLDKILPTFTEYNITAYYHPNYTFTQFLV